LSTDWRILFLAAAEKPPVASTPSTLAATIRGMPASSTGSTLTQIDNKTNEAPSDTSKLDVGASSRGDGKDTSKVSGNIITCKCNLFNRSVSRACLSPRYSSSCHLNVFEKEIT